jgi:hypothetical protein
MVLVSFLAFLAIAFIFCVIMFSWIKTSETKPNYFKDFGILISTIVLFVCLLYFKDSLERCQKEVNNEQPYQMNGPFRGTIKTK